jgi:hypothetical protein
MRRRQRLLAMALSQRHETTLQPGEKGRHRPPSKAY